MAVPHVSYLKQPAVLPLIGMNLNLHQVSLSMEAEVTTGADA